MKTKSAVVGIVTAVLLAAASAAGAQGWMGGSAPARQDGWMGGRMDFYLGAAVGHAKADVKVGLPSGVWFDSTSRDETDVGWKIYGGWQFYRGLAFEVGYTHLGRFSFDGSVQPPGTVSQTYRVDGYTTELVATLPVASRFSILARIGGIFAQTSPQASASGPLVPVTQDPVHRDWNWKTGLGVQYELGREWALRAEWDQYRRMGPNNLSVDLYSLGMIYRIQ
jgi:OOP family OmpA-OmpF porin